MVTKRFINNIFFYFFGTFATKILQFIFIPMYSFYVSSYDFGYFNLIISLISLMIPILYQSIWEGMLRFTVGESDDVDKIINTTNIFSVFLTITYSLVFIILNFYLKIQYGWYILLLGLSQFATLYWQFSARALQANKIFVKSTIINTVMTIILNFIFVLLLKYGILALFIANIGGNLAMVIYLELNIRLFKKIDVFKIDKILLKEIIAYSSHLSVNSIAWWLISSANNFLIIKFLSAEANGIYAMSNRFGSMLAMITSIFNMAWIEESFRTFNDKEGENYFNYMLNIMHRIIFSGIIVLIPVTYIIYKIMVFGDYQNGVGLTIWIYMAAGFSALASHLGSAFLSRKESNIVSKTTFLGGMVSILGSILLVKRYGLEAIVGTTVLGYVVMYFIRVLLLKKHMKVEIDYKINSILIIISIIVTKICNAFKEKIEVQILMVMLALIIIFSINFKIVKKIIIQVYGKRKIK